MVVSAGIVHDQKGKKKISPWYDIFKIDIFNHLLVCEEVFLSKVGIKVNFNFFIDLSAISTTCAFLLETNKCFVSTIRMFYFFLRFCGRNTRRMYHFSVLKLILRI
jgi:hypothetical protein